MRRPRDDIYGSIVQGEVGNFLPLSGLFPPDQNFAIVGRRSDDVAIFRVSLGKG
jgi:hypothetical protein